MSWVLPTTPTSCAPYAPERSPPPPRRSIVAALSSSGRSPSPTKRAATSPVARSGWPTSPPRTSSATKAGTPRHDGDADHLQQEADHLTDEMSDQGARMTTAPQHALVGGGVRSRVPRYFPGSGARMLRASI